MPEEVIDDKLIFVVHLNTQKIKLIHEEEFTDVLFRHLEPEEEELLNLDMAKIQELDEWPMVKGRTALLQAELNARLAILDEVSRIRREQVAREAREEAEEGGRPERARAKVQKKIAEKKESEKTEAERQREAQEIERKRREEAAREAAKKQPGGHG